VEPHVPLCLRNPSVCPQNLEVMSDRGKGQIFSFPVSSGSLRFRGGWKPLLTTSCPLTPNVFTDSAHRGLEALLRVTQKRQVRGNTLKEG